MTEKRDSSKGEGDKQIKSAIPERSMNIPHQVGPMTIAVPAHARRRRCST